MCDVDTKTRKHLWPHLHLASLDPPAEEQDLEMNGSSGLMHLAYSDLSKHIEYIDAQDISGY